MNKKSLIFLIAGILIGILIVVSIPKKNAVLAPDKPQLSFINPTVTSNLNKHFIINFKPLKETLNRISEKYHYKNYVYFSYLNNASWVGINERDLFVAASTIKVPLAMSILKMEEDGKLNSTSEYTLDDLDLDKGFGDLYKIGADNTFTTRELMKIMLNKSDNTAMNALYKVLKLIGISDPLLNVYDSMGWDHNNFGESPTYIEINLKTLANMFLSLYNADYLNLEHSEEILAYLTESPFNDQIVAGVPSGIKVAHKIGVADNEKTYSDCGIVYAPNRNYLLCTAMQGADKSTADKFISEISKETYTYVITN